MRRSFILAAATVATAGVASAEDIADRGIPYAKAQALQQEVVDYGTTKKGATNWSFPEFGIPGAASATVSTNEECAATLKAITKDPVKEVRFYVGVGGDFNADAVTISGRKIFLGEGMPDTLEEFIPCLNTIHSRFSTFQTAIAVPR